MEKWHQKKIAHGVAYCLLFLAFLVTFVGLRSVILQTQTTVLGATTQIEPTKAFNKNYIVFKKFDSKTYKLYQFSVNTPCGENSFRYMTYVCAGQQTATMGDANTCKNTQAWLEYAKLTCKKLMISLTPLPTRTISKTPYPTRYISKPPYPTNYPKPTTIPTVKAHGPTNTPLH
jgi:hypothetical protein